MKRNSHKDAHQTCECNRGTLGEQQRDRRRTNKADPKKTITAMKNTLEGINSRLANTEEWISDVEGRLVKSTNQNSRKNF